MWFAFSFDKLQSISEAQAVRKIEAAEWLTLVGRNFSITSVILAVGGTTPPKCLLKPLAARDGWGESMSIAVDILSFAQEVKLYSQIYSLWYASIPEILEH